MRIRSPGICHCRARYREIRSTRVVEPGGDGSRLEIMRGQSCDADDEGAHELQGQVARFPCFGPVSPCYRRRAKPPRQAPGCARFLFSSRILRGNHRRRVVSGVLFFSCYLQANRRGLHWTCTLTKHGSACADGRWRPLRKGRKPRAIPGRAGTGRPRRRSRRVRSRRSPPPCGRRARARGRRAPPADYWALPSPRRGEARARSPIHRAAG